MIKCVGLEKSFGTPKQIVLKDINLEIKDGDFVSINGRSGSGKSTLLYLLSTLDHPSKGFVEIDGQDIYHMKSTELHSFRNHHVGFIFQFHYLLTELSALENVLLPALNLHLTKQYTSRAHDLLEMMNVSHVVHKTPKQMSGGEQQRVAIARALLMRPRYIFADEPTGNLDSANGLVVMNILKQINEQEMTTVCLVTHDEDYSKMAKRIIHLKDGRTLPSSDDIKT